MDNSLDLYIQWQFTSSKCQLYKGDNPSSLNLYAFFHHSHKLHSSTSLSNGIQRGQRVHHIRPQIIQQRDPSDWLESMDNTVTHTAQSCGCRALLVEKVGRGGGVQKVFVLQGSYLRHYSFLSCERRRNDHYVG